jgi:multiple antibiotic resistance protein
MIELFLVAFVPAFASLFVVIDPPGCAPIFASLTHGASPEHRRTMALRATMVAAVILLRLVSRLMRFVWQAGLCCS